MRPWRRSVATIAFIVPLVAATASCGSREATPARPAMPAPETSREAAPETDSRRESEPPPPSVPLPPPAPAPPPEPPASPAAPPVEADDGSCAVLAEPGEPIETVAFRDGIDPANAPRPSNDSERLLFRQLYETLVRVDCRGRVKPGLAASWRLDADGRTWLLTLREDARFSDGTPVTTADVRAGWTGGGDGSDGTLLPAVSRLVQSVAPVDDRILAIIPRRQRPDAPLALAHPDLAVARSLGRPLWPLGTRADRSAAASLPSAGTRNAEITITRDAGSTLRFVPAPRDPRDLLDAGVDLLLTRDPAALDYAATLPHVRTVPLEWRRTHVLLTPGRSRMGPSLPAPARQALADDAIRGEARGAAEPFWWQHLDGCDLAPVRPADLAMPAPRVVYDADDEAARDLAERLVGLGRVSSPAAAALLEVLLPDRSRRTGLRAAGLAGEPLAQARRRGADAAYILSLDRGPIDPCRDIATTVEGVPWLEPGTIVPLVDTRLRAIVRRGRSGVTADGDGALLIDGSGARGGR